jgi:hypothetical protein
MPMDKDNHHILNDLTDIVDELAKVVRQVNPGADWAFIDSLLARVGRKLDESMKDAP